jgi:predicted NodU family carbamoyl transferase
MPAAEDSGTAVGAAYYGLWQLTHHNSQRRLCTMHVGEVFFISRGVKY